MNHARRLAPALFAAFCLGCFNIEPAKKEEKSPRKEQAGRKVGLENQFGIVADADEFGKRRAAANPNPQQNQPPQQHNPPQFRDRRVAGSEGNVGVLTDFVVDFNAARKTHPHLKVLEKSTTGTVLGSAYFSAVSRLSKATFEHEMQLQKELNGGRWPTYQQYVANLKKNRIELAKLPRWQVYAYDDKTGKLFILEDPQLKAKLEGP